MLMKTISALADGVAILAAVASHAKSPRTRVSLVRIFWILSIPVPLECEKNETLS
jgi:hypothetical protein